MKKKGKIILLATTAVLLTLFIVISRATLSNIFRGYVHFPNQYIGDVLTMRDGQKFTIFRRLKVDIKGGNPEELAIFKVKFKFKNFSILTNKRLSVIPAPFLIGMKGFREKDWTINENTNEFQGIYQWSNKERAEQYPETFIFKLMTKRAVKGTVSYEIIPNTEISEYVSTLHENR